MQIQPPSGFAASLELSGLPVLVCGGGSAALSVIRRLLDSGAVVTVIAPQIGATVADQAIAAAARDHGVPAVSPVPATIETPTGAGNVILVGGGPGDLGLLTVAGLEAIKE